MYEDTEQPVLRRILWIVLWFIIVATIAWALVWLLFFRHHSTTTNTLGSGTHTSQSPHAGSGSKAHNSGSGSSSTATNKNTGSSTTPPATSTGGSAATQQAPSSLANTGAGDVFLPFIAASVAGSTVYYVRLRKKLTQ